ESRRHWECLKFRIVARFGLGGRHVSDWSEQATVVEPLDPFQGGELDKFQRTPRSPSADHLGLVKAVDALGQSIVIAVADAAHGGLDARFGQALGVANRHVLHSPVAMVNQAATPDRAAVSQSLLQGIQHEARLCRTTHPPADDAPGIGVDNKSDVTKPCQVATYVKSDSHSTFGRGARNCRFTRSRDRKSTRLNSSHLVISYAVFCLKK